MSKTHRKQWKEGTPEPGMGWEGAEDQLLLLASTPSVSLWTWGLETIMLGLTLLLTYWAKHVISPLSLSFSVSQIRNGVSGEGSSQLYLTFVTLYNLCSLSLHSS